MNTQIRFTSVDEHENRLHMQSLAQRAEQDALAGTQHEASPRPSPFEIAGRSLHAVRLNLHTVEHSLWLAGDELALELGDMLHGHRPHVHHHAH